MTQNQNNISELIFLFLKGELDDTQREELDLWLKDEHNFSLFNNIVDKEEILNKTLLYDNYDISGAWKKLNNKIPEEEILNENTNKQLIYRLIAYAAGIMLPILFAILLWPESKDYNEIAENNKIQSGSSEAVLLKPDGQVVNLKSDTSMVIAVADGAVAVKNEGKLVYNKPQEKVEKLMYNTLKTPIGGEYELVLSDGTHVWLNADSYIKFPVIFSKSQRKVIVGGEVYFDVAKNKEKPFVVDVEGMQIKVLGTQFNVRSYKEETDIITTLVEGKVELKNSLNRKMFLSPGNQILLSRSNNNMEKRKANVHEAIAWKNGRFLFDNRSLEEIMNDLARWYNIEVFYYSNDIREERFRVDVEKYDTIDKILDLIEKTGDVKFRIKGRVIYVE